LEEGQHQKRNRRKSVVWRESEITESERNEKNGDARNGHHLEALINVNDAEKCIWRTWKCFITQYARFLW